MRSLPSLLVLLSLVLAASADTSTPFFGRLVLKGDYNSRPSVFDSAVMGTIATHYGRPTTIYSYDGSNSQNIVITYSVQIGINDETIDDAMNYIQEPLRSWFDTGFKVPWQNPTTTYPVSSSVFLGLGSLPITSNQPQQPATSNIVITPTTIDPPATSNIVTPDPTITPSAIDTPTTAKPVETSDVVVVESTTPPTPQPTTYADPVPTTSAQLSASAEDTNQPSVPSTDNGNITEVHLTNTSSPFRTVSTTSNPTNSPTVPPPITYTTTSATVTVNANYAATDIGAFVVAAQSQLSTYFALARPTSITITSVRSGSIITDFTIVYPSEYEKQVQDLLAQLVSGTFAGYPVTSASLISSSKVQNAQIDSGSSPVGAIVGGVVGGVGGLLVVGLIIFLILRHKKKDRNDVENPATPMSAKAKEIQVPVMKNIVRHEELGSGKFGKVYKGVWNHTTPVALKCAQQEGNEEFFNEMDILLKLNHPNVIRAIGVLRNDDNTYLVMEYLSKGSLTDFLRHPNIRGKLSVVDLLNMCVHVAAGLHYLEDRNVVHRDVAARNLLVTEVDGKYIVKLADFGLSREIHGIFRDKDSKIPVKWSPPEVIQSNHYSTKSDVWSFGVAVWEIFTYGDKPFAGLSNVDAVEAIMTRGLRLAQPDNCPDELYEVMLRCWQPDPTLRPSFNFIWQQLTLLIEELRSKAVASNPSAGQPSNPQQVHGYTNLPAADIPVETRPSLDRYVRTRLADGSYKTGRYMRTNENSVQYAQTE